jgi:GDP-L-fucose synthase
LESSHVVPALIRKFSDAVGEGKKEVVVWGTGNVSREFLYVEDAAEGIVLATEKYDKPDPINLGTGKEITIKELANLVAKLTGFNGKIIWDNSKPNGQPRRCLDTSRAKREFMFEARTDLISGLKKTIDWYKNEFQQN